VGTELTCHKCGRTEIGNITCPNGHYICDDCHGQDLFEFVLNDVLTIPEHNPFAIAERLMSQARVPMLGCENAWIAAGAFLAALRNEGTLIISDDQIREALLRTKRQAIGGYCGLTGVCGIAPAIGACFSVILGAACPKDEETAKTMGVVGQVVQAIAGLTGPCCCKAFVRAALREAGKSAQEFFNIALPEAERIVCTYSSRHPHGCRGDKCPDYRPAEVTENSYVYKEVKLEQAPHKADQLQKRALELGVQGAKLIETSSVAVAEWVQWKCKYGCPFYNKDGLHPPFAPSAEETRKVLKEYDKALLLNGPDGPTLSRYALQLEHEAYAMGYYKAFAMLSLPFGAAPS